MRPDADTTNAFRYCLAFAADRTKVQVVFYLAMSNHYHAGVIDKDGRLPEFLECFHKLFAKHQNVLRGRWENFWASEQTSVVELVDPQDALDKMVYALTNPVKDQLVARAREWPGATSLAVNMDGGDVRAKRPRLYFRPDGPMPDQVILHLAPLPGAAATHEEFRSQLNERIVAVERAAALERRRTGTRVLEPQELRKQRWFTRPRTLTPRRRLKPAVACRNIWRRIETLRRNKAFVCAYIAARELAARGIATIFPAGTYWRRRFAGCRCEESVPLRPAWAA